jgi:hypothetical protein
MSELLEMADDKTQRAQLSVSPANGKIATPIEHLDEAVHSVIEASEAITNTERLAEFPLEDTVLELDRMEFLRQCQKRRQQLISSVKYLKTEYGKQGKGKKSLFKILGKFYRKLGNVCIDLVVEDSKRFCLAKRRSDIGATYDDEFRKMENERQKAARAIEDLQKLRKLIANNFQPQVKIKDYSADDVATACGLTRATASYHLIQLAKRGRIGEKENPLEKWRLNQEDYLRAVSYVISLKN